MNELRESSGMNDIRPREGSTREILSYIESSEHIYIRDRGAQSTEEIEFFQTLELQNDKIASLSDLLRPLRMYKIEEEVAAISEAVHITHEAYRVLKKIIAPGIAEYELEAAIA